MKSSRDEACRLPRGSLLIRVRHPLPGPPTPTVAASAGGGQRGSAGGSVRSGPPLPAARAPGTTTGSAGRLADSPSLCFAFAPRLALRPGPGRHPAAARAANQAHRRNGGLEDFLPSAPIRWRGVSYPPLRSPPPPPGCARRPASPGGPAPAASCRLPACGGRAGPQARRVGEGSLRSASAVAGGSGRCPSPPSSSPRSGPPGSRASPPTSPRVPAP